MKMSSGAMKHVLLLLSFSTSCVEISQAFIPQNSLWETNHRSSNLVANQRSNVPILQNSLGNKEEKNLREELARKNEEIENEEIYAVMEGITVDVDGDGELETAPTASVASSYDEQIKISTEMMALKKKLERVTKPRAYPLFLAETACNFAEDVVKSTLPSSDPFSYRKNRNEKEKIVVLGTGWGAAAFLKGIDPTKYDITVISPRNFFLFTPMLAGASVGSVDFRSITEPVRQINTKTDFLEATATEIDPKTKTIQCESVVCEGNSCTIQDFAVEYDYIVYTVGAQTNTFGIPGVREYCCFLKQVEDARRIRTAIVNCFERANLPNLSDEERRRILTFAVIGAGPTGIEFASELRDFVEQDGPKYYPKLLKYVRIKVIEASSTVLAPFDKSLQNAAIEQLTRTATVKYQNDLDVFPEFFDLTELLLDSGVAEVKEDVILLSNGDEIPYGLSVWAAGNGPLPITLQTIDALGELGNEQADAQPSARGRIAVDPWLRALGGEGKIFALGDCSVNLDAPLPATAQVASQQGEYLARIFSRCDLDAKFSSVENIMLPPKKSLGDREETLAEKISSFAINDDEIAAPFQFLNLGILAYTGGGSALAQLQVTPGAKGTVKGKGKIGFGVWRSVYLSKQVSWRNRFLVATDWVKTTLFGRDITRLS